MPAWFVRMPLRPFEAPDVPLARVHLGPDPWMEERRPRVRPLVVPLLVLLPVRVLGAVRKRVPYSAVELRFGFPLLRVLVVVRDRVTDQGMRRQKTVSPPVPPPFLVLVRLRLLLFLLFRVVDH